MDDPVTLTVTESEPEGYLARRVLDALIREDYGGLRRFIALRDPPTLEFPGGPVVRLRRDGFLADHRVDQDLGLDEVIAVLSRLADPCDDVAAFVRECRETLATLRLHAECRDDVFRRLIQRDPLPRGDLAVRVGTRCKITAEDPSLTYYDVLGGYLDHPVYPTARCRLGLSEDDLRAYTPEFAPVFRMRWAAIPKNRITAAGVRPNWWPAPVDVGLPPSAAHDLFPVHPITARHDLGGVLAPEPYLEVTPTLSMRTVAVDAATHLKVPLPISTLGLRNRRTIVPGTLHDGALVQRILAGLLAREPDQAVLLADEQTYGHAGDPLLGYLIRRLPARTAVPVAALLAEAPGGGYVIEDLTDDIPGFFDAYLRVLFGWHVALFEYGIALETHQQNISVLVSDTGLELLLKDNDGALLDPAVLHREGLRLSDVADRRMLTTDREALTRVFVTITLHLCAGAIAFGLADRGLLPLRTGLGLIRDRLDQALAEHDQTFLRKRILDAERLPTKAMVTAGTLVEKARTGAQDINKYYGPPGPNYLREDPCC
jgi:siderophore synthetase component